jgi:hypothetical protein
MASFSKLADALCRFHSSVTPSTFVFRLAIPVITACSKEPGW